ncbi:LysR family transcriptional regulator [Pseudonocardiaceae bacterium YIM PH 21723]|nr:LysR family transcriptional regulator [Pseudonocardiaceae bacterium YIM PH 21723]
MFAIERLRALHAVAGHGSIGAAARALHVTGSAISQQLAKLEREAGTPLLRKHGRGVLLTDAGTVLARHAGAVLAQLAQAEADVQAAAGSVVGQLSMVGFGTSIRALVARAAQELTDAYPALRVDLREMKPPSAMAALVAGDADLAIVEDYAGYPVGVPQNVIQVHLLDDPADVILPADHPLAGRDRVSFAEFGRERWISYSECTVCMDWLLHALRAHGHEPSPHHYASDEATQLAMVSAGLGIAVIPRLGRSPLPANVRAVPPDPAQVRRVYLAYREDSAARPAITAAIHTLTSFSG